MENMNKRDKASYGFTMSRVKLYIVLYYIGGDLFIQDIIDSVQRCQKIK